MHIRQSDLAAYARCAQQAKLGRLAASGEGAPEPQLSATVYGTVMHHALQVMETLWVDRDSLAIDKAIATFEHYWHPDNVAALTKPGEPELRVDEWLPRQTWSGLQARGRQSLRAHWEWLREDTADLLGLEVNFRVPLGDLGLPFGEHTLTGTLDRLSVRKVSGKRFLNVEDFKTGKQPTYLRWSVQFSSYCWATTQPEFWLPWGDADLHEKFSKLARRGTWIDLSGGKRVDAGWRGEQDYARLQVALREYVRAVEADIFPLSLTGATCTYCPFRNGICGGIAVPEDDHGRPA